MLKEMFISGAYELENNKESVNALNVFPVPDGDTGTNMSATIMSAVSEVNKLQKITKCFQRGYKTKNKTKTQNALCNFSKSPHMCKLPIVWLGALCGLCILPIYKWLAFCSCG